MIAGNLLPAKLSMQFQIINKKESFRNFGKKFTWFIRSMSTRAPPSTLWSIPKTFRLCFMLIHRNGNHTRFELSHSLPLQKHSKIERPNFACDKQILFAHLPRHQVTKQCFNFATYRSCFVKRFQEGTIPGCQRLPFLQPRSQKIWSRRCLHVCRCIVSLGSVRV